MARASDAPKYQQVLGKNLKRIRQERGLRQEDVAALAQKTGLKWTAATIAGIETGRRDLSLGEFWLLSRALDVEFESLVVADQVVQVEGMLLTPDELRAMAKGVSLTALHYAEKLFQAKLEADTRPELDTIAERYGLHPALTPRLIVESLGSAEQRTARKLGITAFEVVVASHSLWKMSLTEARDMALEDLPDGTDLRARRGHVTRKLLAKLRECVEDVHRTTQSKERRT